MPIARHPALCATWRSALECVAICDSQRMRSSGWRWAAAAWALTLAAVGMGVATCSAPGDGTHYDLCARGTNVPPATSSVTLTEQDVVPVLHVRLGQSFTARVDGGASPVVEPKVTHRGVICQATRSAPSIHLTVIFVATHAGTTRLLSTFHTTGGSAGLAAGAFAAIVTVAPIS